MLKKLMMIGLVCMLAAAVAVTGCKRDVEGQIDLVYVEWDCATAATYLTKAVLEKADFKVRTTPVSAAAMWQSIASGDRDAMVCAWLPGTHGHYLEEVGDDITNLGVNTPGARIGLVVPQYVTINSIEQLNANKDKFNGRIIGIDPGAGIMSAAEKAIEEYGLELRLMEGSDATMTAELMDKTRDEEWVVVTGWAPHWKFGRWDLKFLQDPKGTFGGEETINTIVRKGLDEAEPKAYAILDNFELTSDELNTIMMWIAEEGLSPEKAADKWIEENSEKVAGWIQ